MSSTFMLETVRSKKYRFVNYYVKGALVL